MDVQQGVVYHPEYDAQIKEHPAGKVFLVRQLKVEADTANSAGDLKLRTGDYDQANRLWSIGARYMRASQSVGSGKSTDSTDYPIIGSAWRAVRESPSYRAMKEAKK